MSKRRDIANIKNIGINDIGRSTISDILERRISRGCSECTMSKCSDIADTGNNEEDDIMLQKVMVYLQSREKAKYICIEAWSPDLW